MTPRGAHPLLLACALSLWSCAGEREKGFQPIRAPDGVEVGVADSAPPVADEGLPALVDAGARPDAGAPGIPPQRRHWVVVHGGPWSEGFRGHLEPPHEPAPSSLKAAGAARLEPTLALLAQLPGASALVYWDGPERPGDTLLDALQAADALPVGVYYPLDVRASASPDPEGTARADVAWLAARALGSPSALRLNGQPALLVQPPSGPGAAAVWSAFMDTITGLPQPPIVFGAVDVWAAPSLLPGLTGAFPRVAPGYAPLSASADRLRHVQAWRELTAAEDARWLALAHPPLNPRLRDAQAPISGHEQGRAWRRALALARQEVDARWPAVLVDGLGGWLDDRQLDPVRGELASDPTLTDGLDYPAYGDARMGAARASLFADAALSPPDMGALSSAPLLLLQEEGLVLQRLDASEGTLRLRLTDRSGGQSALEALVDPRVFTLPAGAALQYRRDHPSATLDVLFEDGGRLRAGEVRLEGGGRETLSLDLSQAAGRRVEGLVMRYQGGDRSVEVTIDRIRYVTP